MITYGFFQHIHSLEITKSQIHNQNPQNTNEMNNRNNRQNEIQNEKDLYTFIQPTYTDSRLNLNNFNYKGKCREPFKYKRNNKRDLIFTGIKYDNREKWMSHKQSIVFATKLMQNTIPHARKVCVIYDDDKELENFIQSCGFEIMKVDVKTASRYYFQKNLNPAIDRFIQLKRYLKQHKGEFDRVALIDFRDVYFFADGFQTISDDEVVFTQECISYKSNRTLCLDYTQKLNHYWMNNCYGTKIAREFAEEKRIIHNVGMIIGGIKPFEQLLDVFLREISRMRRRIHIWGIDNSMLNYLQYNGKFSHINVTINKFSQCMAFSRRGGYEYDKDKKAIVNEIDGCSPIIKHKIEGNSMFEIK